MIVCDCFATEDCDFHQHHTHTCNSHQHDTCTGAPAVWRWRVWLVYDHIPRCNAVPCSTGGGDDDDGGGDDDDDDDVWQCDYFAGYGFERVQWSF